MLRAICASICISVWIGLTSVRSFTRVSNLRIVSWGFLKEYNWIVVGMLLCHYLQRSVVASDMPPCGHSAAHLVPILKIFYCIEATLALPHLLLLLRQYRERKCRDRFSRGKVSPLARAAHAPSSRTATLPAAPLLLLPFPQLGVMSTHDSASRVQCFWLRQEPKVHLN